MYRCNKCQKLGFTRVEMLCTLCRHSPYDCELIPQKTAFNETAGPVDDTLDIVETIIAAETASVINDLIFSSSEDSKSDDSFTGNGGDFGGGGASGEF
jgi:uncharacterized membrane protein YgcG